MPSADDRADIQDPVTSDAQTELDCWHPLGDTDYHPLQEARRAKRTMQGGQEARKAKRTMQGAGIVKANQQHGFNRARCLRCCPSIHTDIMMGACMSRLRPTDIGTAAPSSCLSPSWLIISGCSIVPACAPVSSKPPCTLRHAPATSITSTSGSRSVYSSHEAVVECKWHHINQRTDPRQ
jgi:hypothetical protein